jgi:hypothetical protein
LPESTHAGPHCSQDAICRRRCAKRGDRTGVEGDGFEEGAELRRCPCRHRRPRLGSGLRCPRCPAGSFDPPRGVKGTLAQNTAVKRSGRRSASTRLTAKRWTQLIRRTRRTGELAFYRCYSPDIVLLRELGVAARRRAIDEGFQAAKALTGLDEHQVHPWSS